MFSIGNSGAAPVMRFSVSAIVAASLSKLPWHAWIMRPFVGSPGLPVQFLRANPFEGSFYEAIFRAFKHLFFP